LIEATCHLRVDQIGPAASSARTDRFSLSLLVWRHHHQPVKLAGHLDLA